MTIQKSQDYALVLNGKVATKGSKKNMETRAKDLQEVFFDDEISVMFLPLHTVGMTV